MPRYGYQEQITATITPEQNEWLCKQADEQKSNRSQIIRRAIDALKEKYEREEKQ